MPGAGMATSKACLYYLGEDRGAMQRAGFIFNYLTVVILRETVMKRVS